MRYADIQRALWGTGLICRGGFHPGPDDEIPPEAGFVNSVVIIGNAGAAMWTAFSNSLEYQSAASGEHPLNAWTESTLGDVAAALGCEVVFPFGGPPYHPFQRWAQKADSVFPSPIGPLVHVEFGLWHAYRGALLIGESIDLPVPEFARRPCDDCLDQPCLSSCPVDAFRARGYDVPRCVDHIDGEEGADCIDKGCRARRSCPVGVAYHYQPDQAAFHQRHFLESNRATEDREPGF